MKNLLLILLGYFLLNPLNAEAQGVLDQYIAEGLESNLVLKEKSIELERGLLALKDAKSFFLPSMEFQANYSLAIGGRTIDLPLGTLLNPVYSTLNQLTGTTNFPQLENISEQFLPNNFYDARFRVSMSLYNRDLKYQRQIRSEQNLLSRHELAAYEAHLIQEIKIAYYNFCSTYTAVSLIQNSKELVLQNLKDNQSLLKNGKVLPAAVLRAESEVENMEALLIEAENNQKNASNYLNFLLNRPLEAEILFEDQILEPEIFSAIPEDPDFSQRPETLQVKAAESITQTLLQSGKDFWVPKISAFADLGSQAFDWRFDNQSRYLIGGITMSVPIFQGGRNRSRIQQTSLDVRSIQTQSQLIDQKLKMEFELTKNELKSQQAALKSAEKKLQNANTYFKLMDRGYQEGVNSLIEFMDARNQLTEASLQKNLLSYQLLRSLAQLERQLKSETF